MTAWKGRSNGSRSQKRSGAAYHSILVPLSGKAHHDQLVTVDGSIFNNNPAAHIGQSHLSSASAQH